jgi:dolichol-phosphate mannosyltransferase
VDFEELYKGLKVFLMTHLKSKQHRTWRQSRPNVLIILPAYNEEGKVGRVISKILAVKPQLPVKTDVLVVDDGSGDGTVVEAERLGALVVKHHRNMGVGAAIRTGIDYAQERDYDIAAVMSSDDQHEPSELWRILEPIFNGECELVQGSRWLRDGEVRDIPLFRSLGTRFYAVILSVMTPFHFTDGTNGFRAFSPKLFREKGINIWQSWLNRYELEPYILYTAAVRGCRIREVPITIRYHPKSIGYTKMAPLRDWWRLFRPLVFLKMGLRR